MVRETKTDYNFCSQCGHQNRRDNLFCSKCGKRIIVVEESISKVEETRKCPTCGKRNPGTSRFCSACSESLVEDMKVVDEDDFVLLTINVSQIDFENHRDLNTISKRLKSPRVLIDLSKVTWVDSTGIGALVTLSNRLARTQQEIKIFGMTPRVLDAFKSLQVDNILDLYSNVNEAIAAWGLPSR